MPGQYDILRSFLSDKAIAFHPQLARILGGINEAILFQQLAYWSDKGSDPDWIYKTQKDIEFETTLTRTQQENARAKLRRLGVVEEVKKSVPAKLYYRVVWDAVFILLEAHAVQDAANLQPRIPTTSQDAGNLQARMQLPTAPDSGKPASKSAGNVPAITKSTQRENNKENAEDFEISKEPTPIFNEDRDAISTVIRDFARELADTAPLPASVSRAYNTYKDSGVGLEQFLDTLYECRRITQENTASIRTESPKKLGPKPKMSYFFSVVEDKLGLEKRVRN